MKLEFAYVGHHEYRGFFHSEHIATVHKIENKFYPQVKTVRGVRYGKPMRLLEAAEFWCANAFNHEAHVHTKQQQEKATCL